MLMSHSKTFTTYKQSRGGERDRTFLLTTFLMAFDRTLAVYDFRVVLSSKEKSRGQSRIISFCGMEKMLNLNRS